MSVLLMTLVIFLVLIIILFIGTPISLGLGFLGMSGILIFLSPSLLSQLSLITFTQASSVTTLMIPLFILMAELLANSGVASDMFDTIARKLHRVPGNLGISSILASAIFSAVCGSAPATAATIGTISIPSMISKGYDPKLAAGLQAAGGTLGIMIPPSITFIMYGIITETSIVKMFMAGILPGLLLAALLVIYLLVGIKINPKWIDQSKAANSNDKNKELPKWHDFVSVGPILILIAVVLGLMYTGIVTATEDAAIGAIGAFLIVILRKRATKDCMTKTMLNTTKNSCMILFLMFGGLVFAFFLSAYGLPQELAAFVISLSPNRWITYIAVMIVLLILGCFLEPVGILMITMPFIFPTLMSMGFDPVWLGITVTVACMIGMITPPVGMNLFVLKGAVKELTLEEVIKGAVPMLFVLLLGLIILSAFPVISLWLPNTM